MATLTDPGSLELVAVDSGGTSASKTFTVTGDNIKNIGVNTPTGDFTVSVNGSVVTYNYNGSTTNIGTRNGTFNLTADADTNYKFSGNVSSKAISVDVSLEITPLVDADASGCDNPSPINIDVDDTSGNSGTCELSTTNASFTTLSTPQGDFDVSLSGNTLTYSITEITSVDASASASFNISANADTNHAFDSSGASAKNIPVILNGSVAGLPTTLIVDDGTAIALGDVVQGADTTGKKITITGANNLASVTISSGGSGFEISATDVEANYGTSDVTITNPVANTSSFWIKFDSTGDAGAVDIDVTVSGTKDEKGASDPADVVIDCTATITVDAGGGGDCCDEAAGFVYSIDTTGGQTSVVNNGLSASTGFENGGKLCFNTDANSGGSSVVAMYIVTCAAVTSFPSSMIVDSRSDKDDFVVRYFASDNNCYEATVTAHQSAGVGPMINLV